MPQATILSLDEDVQNNDTGQLGDEEDTGDFLKSLSSLFGGGGSSSSSGGSSAGAVLGSILGGGGGSGGGGLGSGIGSLAGAGLGSLVGPAGTAIGASLGKLAGGAVESLVRPKAPPRKPPPKSTGRKLSKRERKILADGQQMTQRTGNAMHAEEAALRVYRPADYKRRRAAGTLPSQRMAAAAAAQRAQQQQQQQQQRAQRVPLLPPLLEPAVALAPLEPAVALLPPLEPLLPPLPDELVPSEDDEQVEAHNETAAPDPRPQPLRHISSVPMSPEQIDSLLRAVPHARTLDPRILRSVSDGASVARDVAGVDPTTGTYHAAPGETPHGITKNLTGQVERVQELLAANPGKPEASPVWNIPPGWLLYARETGALGTARKYVVQKADFPLGIAKKLGAAPARAQWWAELRTANPHKPLKNGNWSSLYAGEELGIPDEWPEHKLAVPVSSAPGTPGLPGAGSNVTLDAGVPREVQLSLAKWGVRYPADCDPADYGRTAADFTGIMDQRTGKALASFQNWWNKQHPTRLVRVDGVLDQATLNVLRETDKMISASVPALPAQPWFPPPPAPSTQAPPAQPPAAQQPPLDAHLPPEYKQQVRHYLATVTDPLLLENAAMVADMGGYPLAAQALRARAAEVKSSGQPQPPAQQQPPATAPAPSWPVPSMPWPPPAQQPPTQGQPPPAQQQQPPAAQPPPLDAHLPPGYQQQVRNYLATVTDPLLLENAAMVADMGGYPLAAQALRARAAEVKSSGQPQAPAQPPAQQQPPAQSPAPSWPVPSMPWPPPAQQQQPPTQGQPPPAQQQQPTLDAHLPPEYQQQVRNYLAAVTDPLLLENAAMVADMGGYPLAAKALRARAAEVKSSGQPQAPAQPPPAQPAQQQPPALPWPPPPAQQQQQPPAQPSQQQQPLDAHMPAAYQETVRNYIATVTDPLQLESAAKLAETLGYPMAAQALRARAAVLKAASPPAQQPPAQQPPAQQPPAQQPPVQQPPLDSHMPADQQETFRDYLRSCLDPLHMEYVARAYDQGYPLAAQALRARAAELRAEGYGPPPFDFPDPPAQQEHASGTNNDGDSLLPVLALVSTALAFS
jgi:hypothetical protein